MPKTIDGASLALQCEDHIKSRNGLALSVLAVPSNCENELIMTCMKLLEKCNYLICANNVSIELSKCLQMSILNGHFEKSLERAAGLVIYQCGNTFYATTCFVVDIIGFFFIFIYFDLQKSRKL